MDKLQKLMTLCKCGIHLTVNLHRDYYESVDYHLKSLVESGSLDADEISEDVRTEMVKTDTIISLQFYPDTPIESYSIYHHDLDAALDRALACLEGRNT